MIKTLQKVGNSKALILDKALLEQLGIQDDDKVQITCSGRSLVITSTTQTVPDEAYEKSKKKLTARYDRMLRNLAK